MRRPTTGVAHACVWGSDGADRLLDWLEVPRRHRARRPEPGAGRAGPARPARPRQRPAEHRLEVDRLVELVDVLVWVVDPQKYADAAVHDRYLRRSPGTPGCCSSSSTRSTGSTRARPQACLADLRRLLDREGLAATPVLAVSARTGDGLAELRGELAHRVAARRAATDRLTADVRGRAVALGAHAPTATPAAEPRHGDERDDLGDALADAAGVPDGRPPPSSGPPARDGVAHTGWPLVRWTGKLRPDPLKRLHLGDERARTSLPPAGRGGARRGWPRRCAGPGTPPARACRRPGGTTCGAPSRRRRTGWPTGWTGPWPAPTSGPTAPRSGSGPSAACSGCSRSSALAGALWLLALVVLGFFQLDDVVPLPRVEGVPLPTLLVIGGLLAGVLLAFVSRPLVGLRARRRGRAAGRRLRAAVDAVAEEEVLAPMLDGARGRRPLPGGGGEGPALTGRQSRWNSPERGSGSWLRRRSVVSVRPEGSRAQTCLRPGRCSQP